MNHGWGSGGRGGGGGRGGRKAHRDERRRGIRNRCGSQPATQSQQETEEGDESGGHGDRQRKFFEPAGESGKLAREDDGGERGVAEGEEDG